MKYLFFFIIMVGVVMVGMQVSIEQDIRDISKELRKKSDKDSDEEA